MSKPTDLEFENNMVKVGGIGNYYGGLNIAEINGKFYWAIEDYSVFDVEEIPQYLFATLSRFIESKE